MTTRRVSNRLSVASSIGIGGTAAFIGGLASYNALMNKRHPGRKARRKAEMDQMWRENEAEIARMQAEPRAPKPRQRTPIGAYRNMHKLNRHAAGFKKRGNRKGNPRNDSRGRFT